MANMIVNTGTTTTGNVLTYSDSSSAWPAGRMIKTKGATKPVHIPAKRMIEKGFWDDVKWKEYKTYRPRKSITGKIIIGKMHRRTKVVQKIYGSMHIQYAKTKELFEEKLRGKA